MENNEKNIKEKTVRGIFWSFSDVILNQGIQFIIQLVLARLLIPEEFGVIGMITVFIAVSNTLIDSGFTNALIREKNVSQVDYSTVFYFNLISSIILYILLYFASPYISIFFNNYIIKSLLRVLALVLIINSFGLIQRTILTRNLDFKKQTIINSIASVISGILAIILAIIGWGVWALVVRMLFMQLIQAILLCYINRWSPSIEFSINSFKKLFGFGWKLLISSLIDTIYNNLYYLIIGKAYSATDLGYYTNAQKLRDVASTSISTAIQKVTYPVLSNIKDNNDDLKYRYRKIIKASVYITFPIMSGLAIVATPLIILLFGEEWRESIIYFKILCLPGMLYPLHALNLNILQVKGRSDLFLKLEIIKKVVGTILIIISIISKTSIIGLIWVIVLNSFISYFINSYYSKYIIDYSTFDQIKDILPITVITVIMFLVTDSLGYFINLGDIFQIIIQVISGVLVYILSSKIFNIEEFNLILDMIKKLKRGK